MADENKNLENEELEDQQEEMDNQDDKGGAGTEDKGSKGGKSGSDDKGEKTFTQTQVTRMMTREKNQGRAAAYKELGIDPKDTKMVNMFKAFVESQKTDEQKEAEKNAENQSALESANQRAIVAEAKAEAMMLGIKKNYVDDAVSLALSKMTEDSDIKTILGELKTKYPIWFEADEDDDKSGKDAGKKTGQKGTGSSIKDSGKDKGGKETKGLGARLAAQRRGSAGGKKSSYWDK